MDDAQLQEILQTLKQKCHDEDIFLSGRPQVASALPARASPLVEDNMEEDGDGSHAQLRAQIKAARADAAAFEESLQLLLASG